MRLSFVLAALAGEVAAASAAPFRIAQLADLHYGEAPALPWGPEQDRNSSRVMRSVFAAEAAGGGIDLAVFSGDQITGNNVVDNATDVMLEVFSEAVRAGVPFATLFGNHDDAPLDPPRLRGARRRRLSTTTRRELLAFELATYPLLSRTCGNDATAPALSFSLPEQCPAGAAPSVSNHYVLVPNASAPFAVLYMLDSGGGSFAETLLPAATAWLSATAAGLAAAFGRALPSLVFVHIPAPEYAAAFPGAPGACSGLADDGITPTTGENDLLAVLRAAGGARAVFTGHDHGNAWCCEFQALHLCFGRHTGYGGYGDWDRGARILELDGANATAPGGVGVRTYIRMEDGMTNSEQWL
jgi:hypothetical protein